MQKPLPTPADVFAVHALSRDVAVLAGAKGTIWWTNDGGDSWNDLSLGLDVMVADVMFLDENTVLAVGEDGGAWVRELN